MMFSFRHRLRRQPLACLAATLAAALVVAGLAFWDKIQDDAIHNAAKSGDSVKVEALLNGKADLIASKNGNGRTALHAAADEGHKNVAKNLVAHGAEVNAKDRDGWTPLHLAADGGHRDVAELLLAHGAVINARTDIGATPLHLAVYDCRTEIAGLFLAHGAEVNAKVRTAGRLCTWRFLRAAKALPNCSWPTGRMSMPGVKAKERPCM